MRTKTYTMDTSLDLPIEVEYQILPAEHGLPEQADIVSIKLRVKGKSRDRMVELLHTLDEAELVMIEDEALERQE
jgi:hypothetical protein